MFVWGTPKPKGDITDAQIILTHEMPNLLDGSPSTSVLHLTNFAEHYHKLLHLPVFAQGNVAELLKARGVELAGKVASPLSLSLSDPNYYGSWEVTLTQKSYCERMQYKRILPVAATPHIWRAIWVYERLGFTVIIPADMPEVVFEAVIQSRWSRAITAYPYELLARIYYLYKGYI